MKILITAGPTREPIDAVRFISNRSSGKMGLALAAAAIEAGHQVLLLHGPWMDVSPVRDRCRCYGFGSSAELKQLLDAHWPDFDCLIMAAAVADYRPAMVVDGKLPRNSEGELVITLQPTPDLVAMAASQRRPGQKIVAFSLEEAETLEARALAKMNRKKVDAIVANPLGTMESQGITGILMMADGRRLEPGRMDKTDFARWLIEQIKHI